MRNKSPNQNYNCCKEIFGLHPIYIKIACYILELKTRQTNLVFLFPITRSSMRSLTIGYKPNISLQQLKPLPRSLILHAKFTFLDQDPTSGFWRKGSLEIPSSYQNVFTFKIDVQSALLDEYIALDDVMVNDGQCTGQPGLTNDCILVSLFNSHTHDHKCN